MNSNYNDNNGGEKKMNIIDKLRGWTKPKEASYGDYGDDLAGDELFDGSEAGYSYSDHHQTGGGHNIYSGEPQGGSTGYGHGGSPGSGMSASGSGGSEYSSFAELKIVKPENFDNPTQIADYLLNGKSVLLNLEDTNRETARRLIDFLHGVSYAIDGSLKQVSTKTFAITPKNINVSGESSRREKNDRSERSERSDRYGEADNNDRPLI